MLNNKVTMHIYEILLDDLTMHFFFLLSFLQVKSFF